MQRDIYKLRGGKGIYYHEFKRFHKRKNSFYYYKFINITFTAILLMVLKVDSFAILFIVIINRAGILIYHIFDYLRKENIIMR